MMRKTGNVYPVEQRTYGVCRRGAMQIGIERERGSNICKTSELGFVARRACALEQSRTHLVLVRAHGYVLRDPLEKRSHFLLRSFRELHVERG